MIQLFKPKPVTEQIDLAHPSSWPEEVRPKCPDGNLLVQPFAIGRNPKVALSAEIINILPFKISEFPDTFQPNATHNPVLTFRTLFPEPSADSTKRPSGSSLAITAHDGKNKSAEFPSFQFGQLSDNEFEACFSSSLGMRYNLLVRFGPRGRAYLTSLYPAEGSTPSHLTKETFLIRHSGLLDPGCFSIGKLQPHATKFQDRRLFFSTNTEPLELNAELAALVDVEIVGNGVLFSLKKVGSHFRYEGKDLQHVYISLTEPKKMRGSNRIYYGGRSTTINNAGEKIESTVVCLHAALLHQVLFGSVGKSLTEELDILKSEDVFVSFDELISYHKRAQELLGVAASQAAPESTNSLRKFLNTLDILTGFSLKLDSAEETRVIKALALYGKLELEVNSNGSQANELMGELVTLAREIQDPQKRNQLFEFLKEHGWACLEREQLFG